MSPELAAIERDIARIAQIIGAQGPETPTVGFSAQIGLPCVMEENGALVWLTMDSGRVVAREMLESRDEAVFRALGSMAHAVASRFGTDHGGVVGVPYWAVLLQRKLELVRSVDPRWYARACAEAVGAIEANTADGGMTGYIKELQDRARAVATREMGAGFSWP